MTTDYKSRKRKNDKIKPMNLASTFRNAVREEKIMGSLSWMSGAYKSRVRKNDNNKPMNQASTFLNAARQGRNNGLLISNN